MNAIGALGALIGLGGIGLLVSRLRGLARELLKRHRDKRRLKQARGGGVWEGAAPAAEVYVPGSIVRQLLLAAVGLAIVSFGTAVVAVGLLIGGAFYFRRMEDTFADVV